MARKRKRQKVASSDARKSNPTNTILPRPGRLSSLSPRSQSARSRALHVLADMRRDPSLTFTQAALNREIDPRTIRRRVASALRKDSSGRVKALPNDPFREALYIPSTKPGESIPVRTKSYRERQLIGQWHAALN